MLGFPSSAPKPIPGYWRRGSVNGYQAYVHVNGHTRTSTPAPPTKAKKGVLMNTSDYKINPHCPPLPPPKTVVAIAKRTQRPTQKQLQETRFTVDRNVPEMD